jgi:hypothetical protein
MRTIHVEPGCELDLALQDATDEPVVLERRGLRYRLTPLGATATVAGTARDPARLEAALTASAGALTGVDIEALLADLGEQRV